jgi:hypothetical protein
MVSVSNRSVFFKVILLVEDKRGKYLLFGG